MSEKKAKLPENEVVICEKSEYMYSIVYQHIVLSRTGAGRPAPRKQQAVAGFADPAPVAGRVAVNEGKRRNITGDHAAGAHQSIGSDLHTANDGGIGADAGPFSDSGGPELPFPLDKAARVDHIGKDHGWSKENIVLDLNAVVDRNIVLNFYPVADPHPVVHKHILAQDAIVTDGSGGHDVAEVPDFRSRTDGSSGVYDGRSVAEERRTHKNEIKPNS